MKQLILALLFLTVSLSNISAQSPTDFDKRLSYFIEASYITNSNRFEQVSVGLGLEKAINSSFSIQASSALTKTFEEAYFETTESNRVLLEFGIAAKLKFGAQKKWYVFTGGAFRTTLSENSLDNYHRDSSNIGFQFGIGYEFEFKNQDRLSIELITKYYNKAEGLMGGLRLRYSPH